MRVLISGAGVAGPTLAYWLLRHGHEVTLVEKAPELRTGGYIIDFWGAGYDIAERMGLLPALESNAYHVRDVRLVNREGRRAGGFDVRALDVVTHGRFMSLPRGELAAAIYGTVASSVEAIFGDEIAAIDEREREARVSFRSGATRAFDLVVGADGLHSIVRAVTFGPQYQFEVPLGYKVAAVRLTGYRPRDEDVYVLYSQPGLQVGRFAMKDDRTLALFVWADDDPELPATADAQRAELRARFADQGWECKRLVDALEASGDLYFDRVSQIRMPRWTHGRVALIGDAASCVSLVAGEGSALAMLAAYVLAGELAVARGDHGAAFAAYEHRLYSFVAAKQKAAARFSRSFVPRTAVRAFVRNQATKLLRIPFVARLAFRSMLGKLQLPTY